MMMNEPNHTPHGCESHGELLEFLYGELDAGRAGAFRAHLDSCAECGTEVLAFSSLRGSIGVWKSEFDRIGTPLIRIPSPEREVTVVAGSEPSFVDSVRAFLAGFPALATGSLAIVAFVGGIALYLLFSGGAAEIARDNGNRDTPVATPAPTASPAGVTVPPKRTEPETAAKPKDDPRPVKIADKPVNRTTRTETRKIAGNERNRPRGSRPTLSGEDDEDDDTIRLADLFDEIGTE
jgi:anti-sigma factor RsiW